jgi:histone-like transcription factor (CBF/NF-Y)
VLVNDPNVAFARDARDLLIECCVEFITLISSEANEIAEKDAKKTIACEHVTTALRQLGYPDYIPEILKVAQEHKVQLAVCCTKEFNRQKLVLIVFQEPGEEANEDGEEWPDGGGVDKTTGGII